MFGYAENTELTNAYYLNSTGVLGIASGDEDTAVSKSEANMKKDSFAETASSLPQTSRSESE